MIKLSIVHLRAIVLLSLANIILGTLIYTLQPAKLNRLAEDNVAKVHESYISPNKQHIVESLITPQDGIELYKDGKRITNNLYAIEYSPVVGNNGDIAYLLVDKSFGYSKVFYNDESIFDQKTSCTNLELADSSLLCNKLIFASYDKKNDTTTIYIYKKTPWKDNMTPIFSIQHASVDDIKILPDNHAIILAEEYIENRIWKIFDIDLSNENFQLKTTSTDRLFLAFNDENSFIIDKICLEDNPNTANLFNSYYALYHEQYDEPFSYGNDFAGRLSWNESYRIRGMLELYKKTGDNDLISIIQKTTQNIMASRNQNIGIAEDEYTSAYGWASRKYSLHDEPQCLMVNQCMIMDALLQAANAGVLDSKLSQDIYTNAESIFNFYEKDYDGNGHYHFTKGSPFWCDGVILPWNQQNVMVNVCLELYKHNQNEKYLLRAQEMMSAFSSEIKEHDGGISWYYWPELFFKGWNDEDDISTNTPHYPASKQVDKNEDISHARAC